VPPGSAPDQTRRFGALGPTIETALRSEFFERFQLQEAGGQIEAPGTLVQFRTRGDNFRDLYRLDVLAAPTGEIARMELTVRRTFIEGNEGLFAQELVNAFLLAAVPDAGADTLREFLAEMNEVGRNGETTGYFTFRGRHPEWTVKAGSSRLLLANRSLPDGASLVVQIA